MANGIDLSSEAAMAQFIAENIEERLHDEQIRGRCVPYAEAGLQTANEGFVLRTAQGTFQITVVRTHR